MDGGSTSKGCKPWWEEYEEQDIVSIDTEMVTKPKHSPNRIYKQHVASVDIVNFKKESIYSCKVFHEPGSFQDNFVASFYQNSLANLNFPSEDEVKRQVSELLKDKLVITIGGESDFRALGLDMADFDIFELQSHFYTFKPNRDGVYIREGHSLKSLSAYYLQTQQQSKHTSLQDAQITMDLFNVYKRVKLQDDVGNCESRHNVNVLYNDIPVIPNPFSRKKLKINEYFKFE